VHRQATGESSQATYGASSGSSLREALCSRRTPGESQVIGHVELSRNVDPISRDNLHYPDPAPCAVMRKSGMSGSEFGPAR
jgi:hypothetical protein